MAITVTPNPAQGTKIAPTTPVAITVDAGASSRSIRTLAVVASFPSSNTRELVWDSNALAFNGFYLNANHNVATPTIGDGGNRAWAFSILRDGGWPADVTILALASDDLGNHVP